MASFGSEDSPLDLSFRPLDLSVKRPISISEQINGVAHFSFALDKVAEDATDKEISDIDVEAWDDSLWNVKSVLKLAEILEDWKTDEETNSEDDIGPWRCKVSAEDNKETTMGYTLGEAIGDCASDNILNVSAVAEMSDFFVFPDPTGIDPEPGDDSANLIVTESFDDNRHVTDTRVADEIGATDAFRANLSVVKPCAVPLVRKRGFDQSLLDCWSNNELEYAISSKRWRFDLRDELDDLGVDMQLYDDVMIEVSDCEEGSDIVELPVVEDNVDDDSLLAEDCRSILHDSDLQIFPPDEILEETELEIVEDSLEAAIPMENSFEAVIPIETDVTLDSLMLSDTDLDIDELLKTSLKVEPNNNSDDFFSNLLIDLH